MCQKDQKPDVPDVPDVPEDIDFPNDDWYGNDGKLDLNVVQQDQQLYRYLSEIGCEIKAVDFWEDDHLVCATVYTASWGLRIKLWHCGDLLECALRGMSLWTALLVHINREIDAYSR